MRLRPGTINNTCRFLRGFFHGIPFLVGFFILLHISNGYCSNLMAEQQMRSGPIPIVNQSPIQLLFLQAIPGKAETLSKGKGSLHLNTTITNTLLSERSGNYEGVVDMEMIRSSLEMQYGIAPGLEIGMSLPLVYSYSGVMDDFILDVEDFFSDPREIREKEDQYKYEYYVKKNGKAFISGKGKRSSGIGDFVLRVKGKIWDEGDILPCLSARFALKVPTGDNDRALGSGKVDYGFGLLLQKDITNFTFYLNADVIFPGDAFEDENISLREFYEVMFGARYKISPQLSILAQVNYITRPFEDTGLQMLERRIYDLLLGINYLTEDGIFIQVGGIEDFHDSCDSGADITFFLNLGKKF